MQKPLRRKILSSRLSKFLANELATACRDQTRQSGFICPSALLNQMHFLKNVFLDFKKFL